MRDFRGHVEGAPGLDGDDGGFQIGYDDESGFWGFIDTRERKWSPVSLVDITKAVYVGNGILYLTKDGDFYFFNDDQNTTLLLQEVTNFWFYGDLFIERHGCIEHGKYLDHWQLYEEPFPFHGKVIKVEESEEKQVIFSFEITSADRRSPIFREASLAVFHIFH